jgi:hypothetical protein
MDISPERLSGLAAYIDTTARLPWMIELAEMVPEVRTMFSEMEAIAVHWGWH